ncbi:MAG: Aspartate carbamoyltransferase [uncultured Truepera sp.]|uniref:Aspartate carbamoyltransferase n=1 Tax=uncultured Truepera sp. TaxID=543023 RepID=A0A6J4VVC0_9DEIN|nr:MAG: Aspartate carbamoyltransferase [uncultured Truepera sp.]
MTPTHLLDTQDWSVADVTALFNTADVMAQVMERTIKKVPALQGFTVGTLFFEPSTRTRLSFERAARAQSADVVSFAAGSSSLSKGESLKDTLRTVDAMQADLYVVRHAVSGVPHQLARWTDARIVNAGDGRRAHPTQALLDAYTFQKNFSGFDGFAGKKLAIVGDVLHSRVARSNAELWTKLGAQVTLCGPRTLLPPELEQPNVTLTTNIREAAEGAHAVMALRLQGERMQAGLLPSLAEYRVRFGVTEQVMAHAHPDALVMHPGPINRDVEISGALADSEGSVIEAQVANGVSVRMAVLYMLLVGRK